MEIDKVQLAIMTLMDEQQIDTPGAGLTLKEISKRLPDYYKDYVSQMTVNRKVWALRDRQYVTAKIKDNKADMFYLTEKGKILKKALWSN